MLDFMQVNNPSYPVAISTTRADLTLDPDETNCSMMLIYNNSTSPLAVWSSIGTAFVQGFPATDKARVPLSIIPPGFKEPYHKRVGENIISLILPSGATSGEAYIQIGSGK